MSDDIPVSPYAEEPQQGATGDVCDPTSKSCSSCRTTNIVRGIVAFLAIGTAGVYGAITVKPEVAEYLSFLPGMEKTAACAAAKSSCSASSCSSACSAEYPSAGECPSTGCSASSACAVASRAKLMETCSRLGIATAPAAETGIALTETAFEPDAGTSSQEPAAGEESELPPAPPLPVQ